MDVFRGGYGVLKLQPRDLYRLLPGEYADMIAAAAWRNGAQQPRGPMDPISRKVEQAKFDALRAERRARG